MSKVESESTIPVFERPKTVRAIDHSVSAITPHPAETSALKHIKAHVLCILEHSYKNVI
jgi:hypothetical protein